MPFSEKTATSHLNLKKWLIFLVKEYLLFQNWDLNKNRILIFFIGILFPKTINSNTQKIYLQNNEKKMLFNGIIFFNGLMFFGLKLCMFKAELCSSSKKCNIYQVTLSLTFDAC